MFIGLWPLGLAFLLRSSHPVGFSNTAKSFGVGCAVVAGGVVPGLGKTVNGSTRWINLVVIQLQASEVAKMCLAFYLAGFLVRFGSEATQTFWGFFRPLIVTGLYGGLLCWSRTWVPLSSCLAWCCACCFWPVAALVLVCLPVVGCGAGLPGHRVCRIPDQASHGLADPGNTAIPRPIS